MRLTLTFILVLFFLFGSCPATADTLSTPLDSDFRQSLSPLVTEGASEFVSPVSNETSLEMFIASTAITDTTALPELPPAKSDAAPILSADAPEPETLNLVAFFLIFGAILIRNRTAVER